MTNAQGRHRPYNKKANTISRSLLREHSDIDIGLLCTNPRNLGVLASVFQAIISVSVQVSGVKYQVLIGILPVISNPGLLRGKLTPDT